MFWDYAKQKHQGGQGQQKKAVQMLQSRKINSVKSIVDGGFVYVKAVTNVSYKTTKKSAVVQFDSAKPIRGNCNCAVGLSGLCCHVLALLLYLKHFHAHNEKLLALTCTQQLQKWHKHTSSGSIPMVPLTQMKARSANVKLVKGSKELVLQAADPISNPYLKRNVPQILKDLEEKLKKEKNVEQHVYSVLNESAVGRASSVGLLLNHRHHLKAALATSDHNYDSNMPKFDPKVIDIDPSKIKRTGCSIKNASTSKAYHFSAS